MATCGAILHHFEGFTTIIVKKTLEFWPPAVQYYHIFMNCNAEMNAFQPKSLNRISDKVIERNQPKSLNRISDKVIERNQPKSLNRISDKVIERNQAKSLNRISDKVIERSSRFRTRSLNGGSDFSQSH